MEERGMERNLGEQKKPSDGNGKSIEKTIVIGSSQVRNVNRMQCGAR